MDLSKLNTGQQIALGSGVVLVISLFTPWFGISGLGGGGNAFDVGFFAWGGLLLAIAGVVILALKAFGTSDVSMGSIKAEQIALILTGLGTLFILLRLILGYDILGVNLDRKWGIFLATLAAIGATAGVFMTMKEAGIGLPTADDFKSVTGGGDDADE